MRLTNLYTWRQVIRNGYLPIESVLSTVDICDEAIICVDPDFDDDVALANYLSEKFQKIRVVYFRWPTNVAGDGSRIGIASQFCLNQSSGDYCLNIQCDEIYPAPLMEWIRDEWEYHAKRGLECMRLKVLNLEHNAQQFQGGEKWDGIKFNQDGSMTDMWNRGGMFNGSVGGAGYNKAVKLFKHCSALRFAHDGWSIDGCGTIYDPKIAEEYPILHLHDHFRDTLIQLRQTAAREIWTDHEKFGHYQTTADGIESTRDSWWDDPLWTRASSPFEDMMPEYIKSILGQTRYTPRYELLDEV